MRTAAVSSAPARSRPVRGSVEPLVAPAFVPVADVPEPEADVLDVDPVDDDPLPVEPLPLDEPVFEFPLEPFEEPFELPPLDAASTTTVPCMNGWIVQMYANVPAFVNVCDPLCPLVSVPVSKLWSLAVAV
jgi:hypothetical protein